MAKADALLKRHLKAVEDYAKPLAAEGWPLNMDRIVIIYAACIIAEAITNQFDEDDFKVVPGHAEQKWPPIRLRPQDSADGEINEKEKA